MAEVDRRHARRAGTVAGALLVVLLVLAVPAWASHNTCRATETRDAVTNDTRTACPTSHGLPSTDGPDEGGVGGLGGEGFVPATRIDAGAGALVSQAPAGLSPLAVVAGTAALGGLVRRRRNRSDDSHV